MDELWIGTKNREGDTVPVLEFRESAQGLGLLRKARNRLLLTKSGDRGRRDPEFLWRHIARALPLSVSTRGPESQASRQAGAILLLGVAAGLPETDRNGLVADALNLYGWHDDSGNPMTTSNVHYLTRPTSVVLEYAKALPAWYARSETDLPVPAAGVAFARAALRV